MIGNTNYISNKISALWRLLISKSFYLYTKNSVNASFSDNKNRDINIKKLASFTKSRGKFLYEDKEK